MRKEYLFLFNVMSGLLEDVRQLQLWAMVRCCAVAGLSDEEIGPLLQDTFVELVRYTQQLQQIIVVAQQQAEELYIGSDD